MGGSIEEADKTATYPLCTTDLLVIVLVNDLSYAEMMEHLSELSVEPVAGLNIYFVYGAGRGTAIAPAWLGFK